MLKIISRHHKLFVPASPVINRACRKVLTGSLSVILLLSLAACGEEAGDSDLAGNFSLDVPVAYVKRPMDPVVSDMLALGSADDSFNYSPGGNLFYKEVAKLSSPEINITGALTAIDEPAGKITAGDVSDPDVSYDGTKIVFAMKIGEFQGLMPEEQPTWNIWIYDTTSSNLRRVIPEAEDLKAEKGNDFDPTFLPDGRIVFSSDRQLRSSELALEYGFGTIPSLDESRQESAVTLHVMTDTGGDIKQISFNQSHDLNPSLLLNGKILYSRWEHAGNKNQFDIYQVNPDGTGLNVHYGAHSHGNGNDPVYLQPREMPDGRLITTLMPASGTFEGGDLVYIDSVNFADNTTPRLGSTSSAAAAQESATPQNVPVTTGFSEYGRYTTPFPLWDSTNRLLAAWTPCLAQEPIGDPDLLNTNPIEPCFGRDTYDLAPPWYQIVVMDLDTNTQKPLTLPEAGMVMMDPVALVDRSTSRPQQFTPATLSADESNMVTRSMGAIKIRSVYDTDAFDTIGLDTGRLLGNERLPCVVSGTEDSRCGVTIGGVVSGTLDLDKIANPDYVRLAFNGAGEPGADDATLPKRPAKFVRIVIAMPTPPDTDRFAFGAGNTEMRAIAGYAPVEPDGSVYVEVPADTPISVELLDDRGRKFGNSNNWVQVRPGETVECNGCHNSVDGAATINAGATTDGVGHYANIDPAMIVSGVDSVYVPRAGDTMAEARVRLSCETGDKFCTARKLQGDLAFDDVWTNPALDTPEASYAIQYKDSDRSDVDRHTDDGLSTTSPVLNSGTSSVLGCSGDPATFTDRGTWISSCRIVINYLEHIQPLWDASRLEFDAAGVAVLDVAGPVPTAQKDNRCTKCHSTLAVDGVTAQVPAGQRQLDLTSGGSTISVSNPDDDWNTSFNNLNRNKLAQELVGGVLVIAQNCRDNDIDDDGDPLTPAINDDADPATTDPQICDDRDLNVGRAITNFSARRSYLIEKMTETELGSGRTLTPVNADPLLYVDHSVMMTDAELRLLTEWIDLGVHYYNNPYVIP